ncbi:MAG: lipoprotein insertase outer membrane protein LolB [Brachymonas sp.]|nr:lipoprotein insertase outer membrane protein LolB [Brachymonas sp.]
MKHFFPLIRTTRRPARNLGPALLLASSLLAACVTPPKPVTTPDMPSPVVRTGRLSLQIEASGQAPQPQSFIVSFELVGNAQNGSLRIFGPLNTTLANAQWSASNAVLQHVGSPQRSFASLDDLLHALTGAPLPAAALFDWINGRNTQADGWQADLSQYAQGRIRAQRHQPPPAAKLQLILQ